MNENINNRNWYTIAEFAKLVNKSPETIRRWGNDGIIQVFKAAPKLLAVKVTEYDRYLNGELMNK